LIIPFKRKQKPVEPQYKGFALGLLVGAIVTALALMDYVDKPLNFSEVDVASVYDGDTFRANFPCDEPLICANVPIRVNGVDTPEMAARCAAEKDAAIAAKQFTQRALRGGKIFVRTHERDDYERIIAEVYIDGENLAHKLIEAGHGRRYTGGSKRDWCTD